MAQKLTFMVQKRPNEHRKGFSRKWVIHAFRIISPSRNLVAEVRIPAWSYFFYFFSFTHKRKLEYERNFIFTFCQWQFWNVFLLFFVLFIRFIFCVVLSPLTLSAVHVFVFFLLMHVLLKKEVDERYDLY